MGSRDLGKMFGTVTSCVEVEEPSLREIGKKTQFTERHGGLEATIDMCRRVLCWIHEYESMGSEKEVIFYLKKKVHATMQQSMKDLVMWSKKDDN